MLETGDLTKALSQKQVVQRAAKLDQEQFLRPRHAGRPSSRRQRYNLTKV